MNVEKLESTGTSIVHLAEAMQITTTEQHKAAAQVLQDIKAFEAEVHATFDSVCDMTHKAWKEAVAKRDFHLAPAAKAKVMIRQKTGAFIEAQEQARVELVRQAKERAEAAERAKVALEAKKLPTAQRKALLAAPIVVAVAAPEPIAKIAGQSHYVDYGFVIVDKARIPAEFLIVDEVAVGKIVKAMKEQAEKIVPGIKVTTKTRIVTR